MQYILVGIIYEYKRSINTSYHFRLLKDHDGGYWLSTATIQAMEDIDQEYILELGLGH